jgi:hypothetical protein
MSSSWRESDLIANDIKASITLVSMKIKYRFNFKVKPVRSQLL